ncbi:MAG TPA: HEAT repeat domain-containing protein [Anaerolineales bacterium]|nr:HEAT repeat domain-containing protein [Anaerolineales bacterium]
MNTLKGLLDDLTGGDETRAEAAVPQLVAMGEAAIPSLLDLTRSTDSDVRWWGLRALASSPHSRTEWLIPFLNDPAPEVRQCSALGLAGQPDESAVQPLVHALNDEDSMVASLAANALVKIGGAAVPSLVDAVKRPPEPFEGSGSQSQRIHALRALAEIRDPRAIPVMMQVMQEDSALLQHWAQEGLERLGLDMVYIKPL